MKSWKRLGFCLAAVTALYAFHVHLKTAKIFSNPTWDSQDEVGQFWSEAAFQYRFAKFFASHPIRDWGQLSHDRAVQYPDTIDDWAEFTVAMEPPVVVVPVAQSRDAVSCLCGLVRLSRFQPVVVWHILPGARALA